MLIHNNMKLRYVAPSIEIVEFNVSDVVQMSDGGANTEPGFGPIIKSNGIIEL